MSKELREQVAEIVGKLEQVDARIAGKRQKISELEQQNAGIIESSLNKSRLPASVSQRRGKIVREHSKMNELLLVRSNLNEKLVDARRKLDKFEKTYNAKIILEQIDVLLHLCKQAQEYLQRYTETVNEIHHYQRKRNPIERLDQLCRSLQGISKEEIGIDLGKVINAFSGISIVGVHDNNFIENIEIALRNSVAMINATNLGKRGYPAIKMKQKSIPLLQDHVINRLDADKYNAEMKKLWKAV